MPKGTAAAGAVNGISQAYARRLADDGFDVAVVNAAVTRAQVVAIGRKFLSASGDDSGVPRDLTVTFHAQRASAGLIFRSAVLANPDLPQRFRQDATLDVPSRNAFFTMTISMGFVDYPRLATSESA